MPTTQQNLAAIYTFQMKGAVGLATLDEFFAARAAIVDMTSPAGFVSSGSNPRDFATAGMFEELLGARGLATDAWLNGKLAAPRPTDASGEQARYTDPYTRARQAAWDKLRSDPRPLRELLLDRMTAFDAWLLTPNDRRGFTPWVATASRGAEAIANVLRNDPNPNVQRKLLNALVAMPWPTSWSQEFLSNSRLFDDYIERLGASKYDYTTRTGLQNLALRARDAFRRPETFTAMQEVTGGGEGGGAERGGSSGGPGIAWYRQPTGVGALMAGLAVGVLYGVHRK